MRFGCLLCCTIKAPDSWRLDGRYYPELTRAMFRTQCTTREFCRLNLLATPQRTHQTALGCVRT